MPCVKEFPFKIEIVCEECGDPHHVNSVYFKTEGQAQTFLDNWPDSADGEDECMEAGNYGVPGEIIDMRTRRRR